MRYIINLNDFSPNKINFCSHKMCVYVFWGYEVQFTILKGKINKGKNIHFFGCGVHTWQQIK